MTLSVVYWLFDGPRNYTTWHVNAQLSMLKRHLRMPFKVICITENTDGLDRAVEVYSPLPVAEHLERASITHLDGYPSCKRRLWNFSDRARELGPRIMANDLDTLYVGDITPMVDRDEDLVVWRSPSGVIQGAAYLLTPGTHCRVWDSFVAAPTTLADMRGRFANSDQGWMNYTLDPLTPAWTEADGAYIPRRGQTRLPDTARLVSFSGHIKPGSAEAAVEYPWISECYNAQL